jgi:hypothetical protein
MQKRQLDRGGFPMPTHAEIHAESYKRSVQQVTKPRKGRSLKQTADIIAEALLTDEFSNRVEIIMRSDVGELVLNKKSLQKKILKVLEGLTT